MVPQKTPRRTILVIEDDTDIANAVAEHLREGGYSVETIGDGDSAWRRLLEGGRPSLIVLDLKLPGLSGWDLLARLRESTTLVNVPVVVASAFLGSPVAGALAWLKKPFAPQDLFAVVQRLVPG